MEKLGSASQYWPMGDSFVAAPTRNSSSQLLRYCLVGMASNFLGYLLYLLITFSGVEPKITMTLLYIVGAAIGFVGNRQWSFAHEGAVMKSGIRYCIAHIIGYLINFSILLVLVDKLGFLHQWVQAMATIIVAGFLFWALRNFVFSDVASLNRDSR